jgi:NADH dehydrogenase [ubiquinone] 1 alpha subcomplex assembly factor 5
MYRYCLRKVVYPRLTNQRHYATYQVFDRDLKRDQRNRAASFPEQSRQVDYLRDEVAHRIIDRLYDVKRKLNVILDLGAGAGHIAKLLKPDKCDRVIMVDSAEKMLYRDVDQTFPVEVERLVMDEERLEMPEDSVDAVVSGMSLHWINDLPSTLVRIRRILKPDSPFIAALIGGDSLYELRTSLQLAELEREGGISPRVSPQVGKSRHN